MPSAVPGERGVAVQPPQPQPHVPQPPLQPQPQPLQRAQSSLVPGKGGLAAVPGAASLKRLSTLPCGAFKTLNEEPDPAALEGGQVIWEPRGRQRSATPVARSATPRARGAAAPGLAAAALTPPPSRTGLVATQRAAAGGPARLRASWSPTISAACSPVVQWRTPHLEAATKSSAAWRPAAGMGQAGLTPGCAECGPVAPKKAPRKDLEAVHSPPSESQSTAASTPSFEGPGPLEEVMECVPESWPPNDELFDTSGCTDKGHSQIDAGGTHGGEAPQRLLQECLRQYHEEQRQWQEERDFLRARVSELERRQEAVTAELAVARNFAQRALAWRSKARRLRRRLRLLAPARAPHALSFLLAKRRRHGPRGAARDPEAKDGWSGA